MARQANAANPISYKQFNMIVSMFHGKEIDPNGTVTFDGVAVSISKLMAHTVVVENGKTRNNWETLPKLNAKMASDLIGWLVTLPKKGSNNGPITGGTAAPSGWDSI